jgi:hypothetical protein
MPRKAAHTVEPSACLGSEYKWGVDVSACIDASRETPDQAGFAGRPELTDCERALQLRGRCHMPSVTQQGDDVSTHPRSVGDRKPGVPGPDSSVESCPPNSRREGAVQEALPSTSEDEAGQKACLQLRSSLSSRRISGWDRPPDENLRSCEPASPDPHPSAPVRIHNRPQCQRRRLR